MLVKLNPCFDLYLSMFTNSKGRTVGWSSRGFDHQGPQWDEKIILVHSRLFY